MRTFVAAIAVLLASTPMMRAADTTLLGAAEAGDHAAALGCVDDLAGLPAGHYTLRASIAWQQHKPGPSHVVNYPPMQLARDGRDDSGRYPIATLDIPRDEVVSTR